MTQSLEQIITGAKEELKDNFKDAEYPTDLIHEITGSACLMPNYSYLKLACENMHLALDEPDCGPAFDGSPTPINIIVANLYENISNELHQYLYVLQDEDFKEAA